MALAEMIDKAQTSIVEPWVIAAQWKDELIKLAKSEEPVSEDLEEAAHEYADLRISNYETAFYAFMSGAKWQKEQMIKDAVDGWVFRGVKDGKLRISDNKECWNGIRIPEKSIEKSYLFCTTDDAIKVKLVIVKEE